jgi:hypothetical protein
LDDFQQAAFDQAMMERERAPKGPAAVDDFSPFGPTGLLDARPTSSIPGINTGMHPGAISTGGQARAIPGSG